MKEQARYRWFVAFTLQLFLVAVVLLNLLAACAESLAIQWVRFRQQQSRDYSGCTVLYVSEKSFSELAVVKGRECIIDGCFYEIVSVEHRKGSVVLTIFPDPRETGLQKSLGRKIYSGTDSSRLQKMPASGFLYFESWTLPRLSCRLPEETPLAGYRRSIPERTMSIDLPPPRHRATRPLFYS